MYNSHIYVRDDQLLRNYDGSSPRRTIDDLLFIITEIIPIPPTSIKQQRLGFLVYFNAETDVNFIFKPEIQAKLQEKQLSARLSYETENFRDIYIYYNLQQLSLINRVKT